MRFLMLIFFGIFFISKGFCYEWKKRDGKLSFLSKKIDFHNRSSCAKRSRYPTRSVFLIVDSVNIGKAAYRLAKVKNIDTTHTTKIAIEKFRYTLVKILTQIGNRLLIGDLPLVDDKLLSDEYLFYNWQKKNKYQNNSKQKMSCHYVKKFSALYSNLNNSRPDRELVLKIIEELDDLNSVVSSCDDFIFDSHHDVDILQFDINPENDFNKWGHSFWYSLKIYLSWAFRYAPELKSFAYPFDFLFKSADIEEMLLFFSNGCESISLSECSDYDLSLSRLNTLTATSDLLNLNLTPWNGPLPGRSVDFLMLKPLPLLEDDHLNLSVFENSHAWVENFRSQFLNLRGFQKLRLRTVFNRLFFLTNYFNLGMAKKNFENETHSISPESKKELFLLCSEYQTATDLVIGQLVKDLDIIKDNKFIQEQFEELMEGDFQKSFDFFQDSKNLVNTLCKTWNLGNFWNEDSKPAKNQYALWYQQLLGKENINLVWNDGINGIPSSSPMIKFNNGEILCTTPAHCLRLLLDSMISIASISKSASILDSSTVMSSNLSNPYDVMMSCGAYDPWRKKNKLIFDFFHDLTQGAIFGLLPSPIYVSAELDAKKPVAFSTLLKEGKVYYAPEFDPQKIKLSLISDLGPLIGVPCAVSISGAPINPFDFYLFNGLSFTGCKEDSSTQLQVQTAQDILTHDNQRRGCVSCAINLQTVSGTLSQVHPIFRLSSFLIKGVVRLIANLKDPHDLSKNSSISTQQLALSYRYHGEITPKCFKTLLKGKSCLPKKCQREMMEEFTKLYEVTPISSNFSCFRGTGVVYVKECEGPIYLSGKKLKVSSVCELPRRM